MKIKLDSIEALAKAHGGLGAHFKKMADHHDGLAKAHGEHAAFMKGKADAMTDEEMHKAAFGKMAEHHDNVAKMHKGMSEHYAAMADEHGDGDKAAEGTSLEKTEGAAAGTGEPKVDAGISKELQEGFMEVAKEFRKSQEFKNMAQEFFKTAAKELFGGLTVPTAVKVNGATAHDPANPGLPQLVARPGEALPSLEKSKDTELPVALAHFGGGE